MSFGYQLISETDRLQEFTELGRTIREHRDENIREIIFRSYRIVYRVDHERKFCQIARLNAKRGEVFRNYEDSKDAEGPDK